MRADISSAIFNPTIEISAAFKSRSRSPIELKNGKRSRVDPNRSPVDIKDLLSNLTF